MAKQLKTNSATQTTRHQFITRDRSAARKSRTNKKLTAEPWLFRTMHDVVAVAFVEMKCKAKVKTEIPISTQRKPFKSQSQLQRTSICQATCHNTPAAQNQTDEYKI